MHRTMEYCCTELAKSMCYMVEYSILCGWIKRATRSIFAVKAHFSGNMTNIAHLGESNDQYETFLELWWISHIFRVTRQTQLLYFASYSLGRHIQRLSSMHPAWLGKRSGRVYLVSNGYFSISDNLPFTWFSVSGISINAWKGMLYVN